ncbi:MAG: heat-inducible transcriptional repressor HrcA [bacterium]|nr:heat-inducible transcriptional repressor HrcA [bacterium]
MEKLEKKQEKVLKAIVQNYIETGKPIASNKLVDCCGSKLSSASIRVIMAGLEELEYIWQPYTSAGRIPTDKGYRFYVDQLMEKPELRKKDIKYLSSLKSIHSSDVNDIIKKASEIISGITHYTSLVFIPTEGKVKLRHVEFILLGKRKILVVLVTDIIQVKDKVIVVKRDVDVQNVHQWNEWMHENLMGSGIMDARDILLKENYSDEEGRYVFKELARILSDIKKKEENEPIYSSGDINVFDQPEFHEIENLKSFFSLLDSKERLSKIFNYYLKKNEPQVVIGKENNFIELENFSLVTSSCRVGDKATALLAVIGPKRMSYPKVISLLDITAKILEKTLDKVFEESEVPE